MYQNIYYDSKTETIHLWDDETGYSSFPYERYAYILNKNGEHKTIDGHLCTRVSKWSSEAEKLGMVYEHNVAPTTRTLIDHYTNSDDISKNAKILFLDIEVKKESKYSTVKAAANKITSISFFLSGTKKYICLLLDEQREKQKFDYSFDIENDKGDVFHIESAILTFRSEFDLLRYFMSAYQTFNHSIITGWNTEFFDIPYLYNRIINVIGYDWAKKLSPIGIVKKKYGYDDAGDALQIAGISQLDYYMLYKKFTYNELANYKLDTVSKIELHFGKIEYDGDLDQLYATDIKLFAKYNIVDVVIPVMLNEKLDYIDTARSICHEGHVPYEDIIYSSRYIDGSVLTYCRRKDIIVSSNKSNYDGSAVGAYVKLPKPGLYHWIYDEDLTSLYPMTMITLNISPETKYGKVLEWDENEYISGTDRTYKITLFKDPTTVGQFDDVFSAPLAKNVVLKGSAELLEYLIKNNLSIASNGIMYTLDKQGILPEILDTWFNQRDEFKNTRKKFEKLGDKEKAAYYDKRQLVKKYQLNTVYGWLLLPTGRFYDKDNGEAVTTTGKSVVQYGGKAANLYYNRILKTNEDYVIYCDTDSLFLPLLPLLQHEHPDIEKLEDQEISDIALPIIDKVQTFINKSFNSYGLKLHNVKTHKWLIKQELIAKRGFWVVARDKDEGVKKRYALWLVNKEGHPVSEIEIKGIEAIRSNFPKMFRGLIKELLTEILHDEGPVKLSEKIRNFKAKIHDAPLEDIMSPTGVTDVTKWGDGIKGTPNHVRAAINYNKLLKVFEVTNINPISDGDKVIWGYLKQNPYNFKSIALKVFEDIESDEILDFVNNHIDRNMIFDKLLIKKLQQYWDSLNWGPIEMNTLSRKFF